MKRVMRGLSILLVICIVIGMIPKNSVYAGVSDWTFDADITSKVYDFYYDGEEIVIKWSGNASEYFYYLEEDRTSNRLAEGTTSGNTFKYTARNDSYTEELKLYFAVIAISDDGEKQHGDSKKFYIKTKGYVQDVDVDPSKVTIEKGKSFTLTPSFKPADAYDKNLQWYSEDESKVIVNQNGTITGVNSDNKVRVYAEHANGRKDYCAVTIVDPRLIPVKEIVTEKETIILYVNEKIRLLPEIIPSNATDTDLTWWSRSDAVSVDENGLIYGNHIDEDVSIYVEAPSGAKAKYKVNVIQGSTPSVITEIDIAGSKRKIDIGKSVQLNYGIEPYERQSDAKVSWNSSNPSIVTVNSQGKVTGIKQGSAIITAVTEGNVSDTCEVKVNGHYVDLSSSKRHFVQGDKHTVTWKSDLNKFDWVLKNETTGKSKEEKEVSEKSYMINILENPSKKQQYTLTVYGLDSYGNRVTSDCIEYWVEPMNVEEYISIDSIDSVYEYGDEFYIYWNSNLDEFKIVFKNETEGKVIRKDTIDKKKMKISIDTEIEEKTRYSFKVYGLDKDGKKVVNDTVYFNVLGEEKKYISINPINSVYNSGDEFYIYWDSNLDNFEAVFKNETEGRLLGNSIGDNKKKKIRIVTKPEQNVRYSFKVYGLDEEGNRIVNDTVYFEVLGIEGNYITINNAIKDKYNSGDTISVSWDSNLKMFETVFVNETNGTTIGNNTNARKEMNINFTEQEKFDTKYSLTIHGLDKNKKRLITKKIEFVVSGILGDVSSWAQDYVIDIDENNLITDELLDEILEAPRDMLTRAEFCEMLVQLYDSYTAKNTPAIIYDTTKSKKFHDIEHLNARTRDSILKANALGIINGTSENSFLPDVGVTREMLATMLRNTYYAMYGYDIDMRNGDWVTEFDDVGKISSWAVESVRFANSLGILDGNGASFLPQQQATQEMGITLLSRAYRVFNDFGESLEYRINARTIIRKYTGHILECYYNDTLIGEINNSLIAWSSSNNEIASTNGIGLTALGKGEVYLIGKYNNELIKLLINVNKENTDKKIEELDSGISLSFNQFLRNTNLVVNDFSENNQYSIGEMNYKEMINNKTISFDGLMGYTYKGSEFSIYLDSNNNVVLDRETIGKLNRIKYATRLYSSQLCSDDFLSEIISVCRSNYETVRGFIEAEKAVYKFWGDFAYVATSFHGANILKKASTSVDDAFDRAFEQYSIDAVTQLVYKTYIDQAFYNLQLMSEHLEEEEFYQLVTQCLEYPIETFGMMKALEAEKLYTEIRDKNFNVTSYQDATKLLELYDKADSTWHYAYYLLYNAQYKQSVEPSLVQGAVHIFGSTWGAAKNVMKNTNNLFISNAGKMMSVTEFGVEVASLNDLNNKYCYNKYSFIEASKDYSYDYYNVLFDIILSNLINKE